MFWPTMAEDLVELQLNSQGSRERRFAAYPPGSTNETNAVDGGKRQGANPTVPEGNCEREDRPCGSLPAPQALHWCTRTANVASPHRCSRDRPPYFCCSFGSAGQGELYNGRRCARPKCIAAVDLADVLRSVRAHFPSPRGFQMAIARWRQVHRGQWLRYGVSGIRLWGAARFGAWRPERLSGLVCPVFGV